MNSNDLNNNEIFTFVKADKELFAVYQTIYSNTDIELWYDWKTRLKDTMWSDKCYFVMKDNEKIGGAIIDNGSIAYPFTILPYCDKLEFFKQLHKKVFDITNSGTIYTSGMLSEDIPLLLSMGYRVLRTRTAMIRPTDIVDVVLEGYKLKIPTIDNAVDIANIFFEAFSGGIDYEVFGTPTIDECTQDVVDNLRFFTDCETIEQSCIIYDNDKPVAACLIGGNPSVPNGFSGIYDIAVIPMYRNRGIATFMIKRALTIAKQKHNSQAMRLFVTEGNPAKRLYNALGFMPGPSFSPMIFNLEE
jgi:ribosomal protein S18 acetylase RimI-like enzyme